MKGLICLFSSITFVFLMGFTVFASDTTISITSAKTDEQGIVTVECNVENPVEEQQVTIMALKYDSGSLDFNNIVYIDQCEYSNGFILNFSYGSWAEQDAIYAVRVGGTNIDTPAIFIFADKDDEIFIYGDVNNDGIITAADAALTLQHVLNSDVAALTEIQKKAARVNGQEEISAYEASCILSKALNNDYKFEAEMSE